MVSEVMEAQAVSGNPDQVMRAERARVEQEKQMLLGAIRRCHNNAAVKGQSDEEKVNNLLLWGKALNELAHHNSGDEAYHCITESEAKYRAAIEIDGSKAEAHWLLGNAITSQAFLCHDEDTAKAYFKRAGVCMQRALALKPDNPTFKQSLKMNSKAIELWNKIQEAMITEEESKRAGKSGGWWIWRMWRDLFGLDPYDVAGWGIVIGSIFTYLIATAPKPT